MLRREFFLENRFKRGVFSYKSRLEGGFFFKNLGGFFYKNGYDLNRVLYTTVPCINWCLQAIATCKRKLLILHFYFSMSTRYLWLFFAPESIPPPASVTPGRDWALQWLKNCATVTLATMVSQQLFW